ncbi:MAG: hydroxyacylglutathione hydrolase C-terminal domain-containing protein [Burkholderiaceae bacterium]
MNLIPLPAFDDNYFWLLHDGSHAIVIDPGEAEVVKAALDRLKLKLDAILVTHHHADHKFANAVEPGNVNLVNYTKLCKNLRASQQPTLPSTIETERQINPFLRSRETTVRQSIQAHAPLTQRWMTYRPSPYCVNGKTSFNE